MRRTILAWQLLSIGLVLAACFGPEDRRPGLRLGGEVAATPPSDWAFTDEHREIAVEVRTPYLIPHSVTIWCAQVDGELFVGARNPETKRWPAWVDRDPEVRLGIGSQVYEVRLTPLEDPGRIARLRQAYAAKYELPPTPAGESPPIRYWRVEPRT